MKNKIMSNKMPAPPFWASTLTLAGLIILCGLGTWQLQRLQWKNDLIAKLETAYTQEIPRNITLKNNPEELTYGRIEGRFLADKAFLLGPPKMKDETPGLDLVVPLKTKEQTILINMGWTPYALDKQPIYHLQERKVAFFGLLKTPSWNTFTPQNIPENDVWYRLDMKQIADKKTLKNLYPDYLLAEHANYKFDAAFFGDKSQSRQMPNNNHLQYAFFWFSLATVLAVIYTLRFIVKK